VQRQLLLPAGFPSAKALGYDLVWLKIESRAQYPGFRVLASL
jgi:hypothetical protein